MSKLTNLIPIMLAFIGGFLLSSITAVVLAHGGNINLIHGCVKNTGALRIITANGSCNSNETSLDWNAEGLPGTGALVANLHGAVIRNTDFRWRTLKNDDFSGAGCELTNDTFNNHTDLTGVNFTGCNLSRTGWEGVDFTSGFTIGNNNFSNATIVNSNLSNLNLTSFTLDGITVMNSNLSGANMSGVTFASPPEGVINFSFNGSNLTNANLSGITLASGYLVALVNANLTGTNFTGVNFSVAGDKLFDGVTGSGTNFTNANLQGASFADHSLTSIIFSNTTCPDGTNSDTNSPATCIGHGGGL